MRSYLTEKQRNVPVLFGKTEVLRGENAVMFSLGLQAKSTLAPELPVVFNKPRYEEFEYSRNGTIDLMAFLNPKTGKVFGRCTPNHNTQTLSRIFKEHVKTLPSDAPLHYIMDNLNTLYHRSKQPFHYSTSLHHGQLKHSFQ